MSLRPHHGRLAVSALTVTGEGPQAIARPKLSLPAHRKRCGAVTYQR